MSGTVRPRSMLGAGAGAGSSAPAPPAGADANTVYPPDLPVPHVKRSRSAVTNPGVSSLTIAAYRLPVLLHQRDGPGRDAGADSGSATGTATVWTAEWDDSFNSRSAKESIADEVATTWMGYVLPDCFPRPSDRYAAFDATQRDAIRMALAGMHAVPVFFESEALYTTFQEACDEVIGPIFHNVVQPSVCGQHLIPFCERMATAWAALEAANQVIATALAQQHQPGGAFWLHDFHLSLVPRMLRSALHPAPAVVLFLHAPFPTSEVLRTTCFRSELLDGLLNADVLGFHTFTHARHFFMCCKRVLGLAAQSQAHGSIFLSTRDGRDVEVVVSHVGVENSVDEAMRSPGAAAYAHAVRSRHGDRVCLFGLDVCNRLSGVSHKLLAFEKLLQDNSVYRERVALVQRVIVRPGALSARVQEENRALVQRIHSAFGPHVLDYQETGPLPLAHRVAMYHTCDVFLHTPLQEGVNLVPLEYIHCRSQWQDRSTDAAASSLGGAMAAASPLAAVEAAVPPLTPAARTSVAGGPSSVVLSDDGPPCSADVTAAATTEDAAAPVSHKAPTSPLLPDDGFGGVEGDLEYRKGVPMLRLSASASMPALSAGAASVATNAALPPPAAPGVVIMSEFCTAAHILNSYIAVNPWGVDTVAKAIDKALLMDETEKGNRQWRDYLVTQRNKNCSRLTRQVLSDMVKHRTDVVVVTDLEADVDTSRTVTVGPRYGVGDLTPLVPNEVVAAYLAATTRTVFLDYEGLLLPVEGAGKAVKTEFVSGEETSHLFIPDTLQPSLSAVAASPGTSIVLMSAMSVATIDGSLLARLASVRLCPEDAATPPADTTTLRDENPPVAVRGGAQIRPWQRPALARDAPADWPAVKQRAVAMMQEYVATVVGSRIVQTDSVVAWNFRAADPEWATAQVGFLLDALTTAFATRRDVKVVRGPQQVEVLLAGATVTRAMSEAGTAVSDADFVLAISGPKCDDEMLSALQDALRKPAATATPRAVYMVTVGRRVTPAEYFVNDVKDVHALLHKLAAVTAA